MKALMLPNEMFDDGSIQYKNFVHVYDDEDGDECIDGYEHSGLSKVFCPEEIRKITEAVEAGKQYIGLKDMHGCYFEVQWD